MVLPTSHCHKNIKMILLSPTHLKKRSFFFNIFQHNILQSRQIVNLAARVDFKQYVEKSSLEVEVITSCRLDSTKSVLKVPKRKKIELKEKIK